MKNLALKYKSIAVRASVFQAHGHRRTLALLTVKVDHSIPTPAQVRNIGRSEEKCQSRFFGESLVAPVTTHTLATKRYFPEGGQCFYCSQIMQKMKYKIFQKL